MGIVLYTFLSVLIIVLSQFDFIEQYLQIPSSFQVMHLVFSGLDKVLTGVLGEGRTAAFVVGAFWAVVGLGVYVFLRGVAHFFMDLGEGYEARGYVWPKGANRNSELKLATERIIFQILAFLALLFVIFQPLANIVDGPVLVGFLGPNMILQFVVWFIASWLMLHVAVVLLRLLMLKPRLFGESIV